MPSLNKNKRGDKKIVTVVDSEEDIRNQRADVRRNVIKALDEAKVSEVFIFNEIQGSRFFVNVSDAYTSEAIVRVGGDYSVIVIGKKNLAVGQKIEDALVRITKQA